MEEEHREIYGCSASGRKVSWCEKRGCRGKKSELELARGRWLAVATPEGKRPKERDI